MRNEPSWLGIDDIIEFNAALVADTGEPHQLINAAGLESALGKPLNHWSFGEEDPVVLAVVLLLGVARNHPFLQGNKRTALLAAAHFLALNDHRLDPPDDLGDLIIAVIAGNAGERQLVAAMWDRVEAI